MANSSSTFQVSAENKAWEKSLASGNGLFPWQQTAFDTLKGARFSFVVAFMGSGKSRVQLTLAADEIKKSKYEQKQLVIVPQQHIANGFVEENLYLNGRDIKWEVLEVHKFVSEKNNRVIERLVEWLLTDGNLLWMAAEGKPNHIKGLNAVTTHSALAMAWGTLTLSQRRKAIHNLTLRVDEAHHIRNIMSLKEEGLSAGDIKDKEEESNNLGLICSFILKSKDETAHLSITTATPFRGDNSAILNKAARGKFKCYYLPFFDHWATLGIKNFGLEFLMYKGSPVRMCVDRILSEPNERHMVVIPSSTHKWRASGHEHQELLKKLNKAFPGQVLDLVDSNSTTRKANKLRLLAEPRKPQNRPSNIRVVVTCMVGREGTDWCPCSRLHNLSVESTLTLAVQTLGRPFRRFFPTKKEVNCFNYVPEFESPEDGGSVKDVLSHRTNALLTCMIFDESFHPIALPKIPKAIHIGSKSGTSFSSLQNAIEAQDIDYHEFKLALIDEMENNYDLSLERRTAVSVASAIMSVLDSFGISKWKEEIFQGANQFLARCWYVGHHDIAKKMSAEGMDVGFLLERGYDKLVEVVNDSNKSLTFTGSFAERDLRELRAMFNNGFEDRLNTLESEWEAA